MRDRELDLLVDRATGYVRERISERGLRMREILDHLIDFVADGGARKVDRLTGNVRTYKAHYLFSRLVARHVIKRQARHQRYVKCELFIQDQA